MFIDGIGIGGYRSFGELQKIGPFKKINLFIGKNNSGKSNILLFLLDCLPQILHDIKSEIITTYHQPSDFNLHRGNNSEFNFSFAINKSGPNFTYCIESVKQLDSIKNEDIEILNTILNIISNKESFFWVDFKPPFPTDNLVNQISDQFRGIQDRNDFKQFWSKLTSRQGGQIDVWIKQSLLKIAYKLIKGDAEKLTIDLIPAIREIGLSNSQKKGDKDFSGQGIIEELFKLQSPTIQEEKNKERFEKINKFVQTILRNKNVRIEIPHDKQTINVRIDGKLLPIENMGTGFHEATIIAAAATAFTSQLVCIEEPELHLHPLMEKELLRYLSEQTENQYFITTHSNNLINTPEAAIFHVQLANGQTTVTSAITDNQKFSICADLGYKSSDLLQANCIIWTEGPSDRIYLNRWISTLDETLVEGLHYSIMFYGGKLLSHLSADDPEVEEFISLRKINRNISILIDSDKSGQGTQINKTKKRVRDEFNKGPGFAWVTNGREIENYIDPNLYLRAVKNVHPKAKKLLKTGKFDHIWYFSTGRGKPKSADKVKVAREVIKSPANLNRLDLAQNVKRLVKFIKDSNGIEE
ncbi:ATP-dependent nuclease [Nitrospina sp. 32_T5]|uniref:ATP-dependent nuclease n=1 Tax=unclassified Nitrospina TaxID=2638683 RepID=UPI003F99EC4D